LKPGDVVVSVLVGAQETKMRPAVVIASATYLAERPDVLIGILTTRLPKTPAAAANDAGAFVALGRSAVWAFCVK
jgi:mRNA-degrading endonuclease toxin of MazEF toxin-antitoxin module